MKYKKFFVKYTDEDGEPVKHKFDSRSLAIEYKMFLNSLQWHGEKIFNIEVHET